MQIPFEVEHKTIQLTNFRVSYDENLNGFALLKLHFTFLRFFSSSTFVVKIQSFCLRFYLIRMSIIKWNAENNIATKNFLQKAMYFGKIATETSAKSFTVIHFAIVAFMAHFWRKLFVAILFSAIHMYIIASEKL